MNNQSRLSGSAKFTAVLLTAALAFALAACSPAPGGGGGGGGGSGMPAVPPTGGANPVDYSSGEQTPAC